MRFGIWEIILIALLVIVLFGSAKIPGMMKNLAGGIKVFKKEIKDEKTPKVKKKVSKTGKK
jgi:Sec-independent protein secretion pathway components